MKADRLLSALLLLQSHPRLTGRQLARRLEVSLRTVHRDMEALAAAGVPVFAERGAHGGWQLEEGWRTRVPGLSEPELQALLMAQPRVMGHSRLAQAAERALGKLVAALPAPLQEQAESIRKRLLVDTTSWSGADDDLTALPIVQEAVWRDRQLAIRYWPSAGEKGERTVEPLGLVAKASTWYLVARSQDGMRTYRVSRIEEARLLDAGFARPKDFDLAAHWHASTQELRKGRRRYEATFLVEPGTAPSFQKRRFTASTAPAPAGGHDGWIRLTATFDDEAQACFVAQGLGPRVIVLAPPALKARVAAEREAALATAIGG